MTGNCLSTGVGLTLSKPDGPSPKTAQPLVPGTNRQQREVKSYDGGGTQSNEIQVVWLAVCDWETNRNSVPGGEGQGDPGSHP